MKPPLRKVIVEMILSAWNDISCETIRKWFKSCALTYVAILGDIAEATPTEMLIDEDEEGRRRNWYIIMMYYLRFSYQKNSAKSNSI